MPSRESVLRLLAEAKGDILVLMQEGDTGGPHVGFINIGWSDQMFDAYEAIDRAMKSVERAGDYE